MSLLGFLFEDVYSDLVKKNPELEEPLKKAKNTFGPKLSAKYLPWLAKILIKTPGEPVEDIVPLVLTFEKKVSAIKAAGGSPDINSYKTTQDLSKALESLGKKKQEKFDNFREHLLSTMDVVYASENPEVDPWVIVMPRTTQESCEAGANTTWCTARTQSQNLFLSYVGRGKDIILFYVINTAEDARKNPNAKLSIGYVGGKAHMHGEDGHVSVNANNNGITDESFSQIVGPERAAVFLNLMDKKAESLGGVHPARQEILELIENPEKLKKKLESFQNSETKMDFISLLLESIIENDKNPGWNLKEIIEILFADKETKQNFFTMGYDRTRILFNSRMPGENVLQIIHTVTLPHWTIEELAKQRGAWESDEKMLNFFIDLKKESVNQAMANNPFLSKDFFYKLYNLRTTHTNLASNKNIPIELLYKLRNSDQEKARTAAWENFISFTAKTNFEYLKHRIETGFQYEENEYFSIDDIENLEPSIFLEQNNILDKKEKITLLIRLKNQELLNQVSFSTIEDLRWAVASNINTPTNTLLNLSSPKFEKSKFVRDQAIKTLRADGMIKENNNEKKFLVKSFIFGK